MISAATAPEAVHTAKTAPAVTSPGERPALSAWRREMIRSAAGPGTARRTSSTSVASVAGSITRLARATANSKKGKTARSAEKATDPA